MAWLFGRRLQQDYNHHRGFQAAMLALLAGVLATGCARPRPLVSVPPTQREAVRLGDVGGRTNANYRSAARRDNSGLQAAGLLGGLTAGIMTAVAESGGDTLAAGLRNLPPGEEGRLVREAVERELLRTGIRVTTDDAARPRLELKLLDLGMMEKNRGLFTPYLSVQGRLLAAADKTLWTATVVATGTRLHAREAFLTNCLLYANELPAIAEDAARQLVRGPIRDLP